ncbi:cyclic nucleotide-binding domain-containing protein [Desulfogranum mediterraneum]|uniref:cyclic nucleotide-binding domain-containing protein n=1 Tax=Desulfogranum mediterraneum TaxID=160661 RepID=UPI0004034EB8|nr:cyclic nucleotide-binding domain-containing protein [Desulfogranum mediterraneum]
MGFPKIGFRICENRQCPLYSYNDTFFISGIAIRMESNGEQSFINTTVIHSPPDKEHCKILNGDLTRIIIEYERADQIPDCLISCSGCTGSIRLEHHRSTELDPAPEAGERKISSILHLLSKFSFFRNIDQGALESVIQHFKLQEYSAKEIILRKGDPGGNFYIVVNGRVDILNDAGIAITSLERGEVFGEMSLICEENVGATVQAGSDSTIIHLDHDHFTAILKKYPALQLYFTRLLAKRLSAANRIRSDDYASAMIGKLEEIPPDALFQTLNANHKTGILTITQLPRGTARFSLRQGALIKAIYGGRKGKSAFFAVLREKQGRFKFTPGIPAEDFDVPEIGYFMKLLMEGLQRLDEHSSAKGQKG